MGWKTQTILVRPAALDGGPDRLLADLGYDKRHRIDDASFESAGLGSIWIGSIDVCIIIYTPFAFNFFDDDEADVREFTDFKNALFRQFPEADIAALTLHSVINHWGFAIFRRGTLIRRQHGHDGNVVCDEGPRLPVEESYISRFQRIETGGQIKYQDINHPEYGDMTDSDFGEPLVFEICRSFTGFPLDSREVNEASGTNFWLNNSELRSLAPPNALASPARPWWRFWG
ncbi:hypothetical protein SAMN05444161_5439 [Rhizobiales bacterium GAS191]|nr:hypothetical protein SAMN05519103_04673 [Rhizobiales bacterium GAS113]SEE32752.1 hypothetical protein SAMN05444161_5439 [Rhizobiales bacterium GAS191]